MNLNFLAKTTKVIHFTLYNNSTVKKTIQQYLDTNAGEQTFILILNTRVHGINIDSMLILH
jgi:hypothetical protein